jgi:hypothetical protein
VTVPPLWKWKPRTFFHRQSGRGWQFCFYQHPDHNPVLTIMRWGGKWRFEFYADYWFERALRKKYGSH